MVISLFTFNCGGYGCPDSFKNCVEVLSVSNYYGHVFPRSGRCKSVTGWRLSPRINAEIENVAVREFEAVRSKLVNLESAFINFGRAHDA